MPKSDYIYHKHMSFTLLFCFSSTVHATDQIHAHGPCKQQHGPSSNKAIYKRRCNGQKGTNTFPFVSPGCSISRKHICPTSAAQRQMEVEIPVTALFHEMMKKLGLPNPTYEARMSQEGKLVASITFYPSNSRYCYCNGTVTLASHPMDSLDAANDDAAKEAIKYMENNENKILKDYNYEKRSEKKRAENCHINKIIENNRRTSKIIGEKDEVIKKMRRCWGSFIESVGDTNDKITDIAKGSYASGTTPLDNDINITLSEIETVTDYLAQLTFESKDQMQQFDKYTYNTDDDSSEADQFPGYYPTPPESPMQDTESTYELLNNYGLCTMDHLSM